MARRYTDRQLLLAQLEHLQYCAMSEAVAKVLTERGDKDVQPYYNTLWKDEKSYNYYPSDVFAWWSWSYTDKDGKVLTFDKTTSQLTLDELQQIKGTHISIWTTINDKERILHFNMLHKDLQPEARQHTLFTKYKNIA